MTYNQEQIDNELLHVLISGLSEYLQGYDYEHESPAFHTLETASLFGNDVPRQGFAHGGSLSLSGLTGLDPTITAVAGLAASVATHSNPVSTAFSIANVISTVFSKDNKSITDHLGLTDPHGLFGSLGFSGTIEDPVTGQVTTQSGRHAIHGTDDLTFSPPVTPGLEPNIPGSQNPITHNITVEQTPQAQAQASDPVADEAAAIAEVQSLGIDTDAGSGSSSSGNTGVDSGSVDADPSEGYGKDGGQIKGYQEGDLVEDDQADTQLDGLGLGPLGVINDPDGTTGVADDLDMDLPVGSYVLNEEAVKLTGVVSVNKMIKEAIDLAIEDGVDLPKEIKASEKIPIRISQGEGAIPNPLVDYIGLKKLENMNNRGLKVRKQREAEEAPVEMAAAPSPQEDLLAQIQPVA